MLGEYAFVDYPERRLRKESGALGAMKSQLCPLPIPKLHPPPI